MNLSACRWCMPLALAFGLLLAAQGVLAQPPAPAAGAIPDDASEPMANRLSNGRFECGEAGYYEGTDAQGKLILIPNDWTLFTNGDIPVIASARIFFERMVDSANGGCDTSNAHVERLDGRDSVLVRALDLETPPNPGKPFDVTLLQPVATISGVAYSLSGWMLSLCGGSFNDPNDCPDDYYISKMLGADPTGGADPNANTVVWTENRNNFNDGRWRNLRIGVTAQAMTMTVFARVNSPFQWHGNHAFIDAMTMVQAPTATLTATSTISNPNQVVVNWDGSPGPDIPLIEGGNFHLLYTVEYSHTTFADWRTLAEDHVGPGSHTVMAGCLNTPYHFRLHVRAEQLEGEEGVFPTQRYIGASVEVEYTPAASPRMPGYPGPDQPFGIFLPAIEFHAEC